MLNLNVHTAEEAWAQVQTITQEKVSPSMGKPRCLSGQKKTQELFLFLLGLAEGIKSISMLRSDEIDRSRSGCMRGPQWAWPRVDLTA